MAQLTFQPSLTNHFHLWEIENLMDQGETPGITSARHYTKKKKNLMDF